MASGAGQTTAKDFRPPLSGEFKGEPINVTKIFAAAGVAAAGLGLAVGLGACGGGSSYPNEANTQSAQAAPATVTSIHQNNFSDGVTVYSNYYSDGHATTCTVMPMQTGATSATGDCVPDGVATGITEP